MALTLLERLRLRIGDRPRLVLWETAGVGDDLETKFQVELRPVIDASESVVLQDGSGRTPLVRDTDYTFDYLQGLATLTTAPADSTLVLVTYTWVVFSDVELADLLEQSGSVVVVAAIQAVTWLLADTERFIRYTFGQETVDRTGARDALLGLLAALKTEIGAPAGLVKADTADRQTMMAPFLDSDAEWSVDDA